MDDINRSPVKLVLTDVRGKGLSDRVQIKLYNQRAQSLNQSFAVDLKGRGATLKDVPAFPFGLAEAFINPNKYRFKSIFVNVPAGKPGAIEEILFVEPARVQPSFPSFTEIQSESQWKELARILSESGIDNAAAWNKLKDLQKAGLLNIHAKTQNQLVKSGSAVLTFIQKVTRFEPARIFALVRPELIGLVREFPEGFHPVPGTLHEFPSGWKLIEPSGSFKTYDKAGNLQITFAQNAAGQFMTDIDLDDHQGIEHAADVLKHKITGKDTHPYDIHEILIFFQGLDPGYELS